MAFDPTNLNHMIATHGVTFTLSSITEGTYNPATGSVTNSSTSYTVKGYPYNYRLREGETNNVEYGDRRIVLSIYDTAGDAIAEPKVGDTLSGIGDVVSITRVDKIISVTAMCYICWVKE